MKQHMKIWKLFEIWKDGSKKKSKWSYFGATVVDPELKAVVFPKK